MRLALLDELCAARAAHRPVALVTALDGDDQRLVTPDDAPRELAAAVAEALRYDRAIVAPTAHGEALVEPHNPPLRLIVIGAVHTAAPLARMARLVGFAVTLVDPRRGWATAARFPTEELLVDWPDRALARLAPDERTAVVTLTHDPTIDDPALVTALSSPAFYIGCVGSTKTHADRLDRLAAVGCTGLARLHGPVGLRINARAPAEIAVSILGEMIACLRGPAESSGKLIP